jgi:hypothetical protein
MINDTNISPVHAEMKESRPTGIKRPILFQGSTGAIGDTFLSSHPMVLQNHEGAKIYVALDKTTPEYIKDLYRRMTILEGLVEFDDFSKENYLRYCQNNGFNSCVYLENINYILHPAFFPLNRWFKYDFQPTIIPGNYVGFQVASSTNFDRQAIPNLHLFVENVINNSHKPIFIGTLKDESLFNRLYPGFREKYQILDEQWRFGKDSIFQMMSNIKLFLGMITFSSCSAYIAALQGVPTLEFWSLEQWMVYTGIVRKNLGDPIHYVQDFYLDRVSPYLIQIFQHLKNISKKFYGNFE